MLCPLESIGNRTSPLVRKEIEACLEIWNKWKGSVVYSMIAGVSPLPSRSEPRSKHPTGGVFLWEVAMPSYQCCSLDESGNPVRYAELRSSNDDDAHREAMALLMRSGRFRWVRAMVR